MKEGILFERKCTWKSI